MSWNNLVSQWLPADSWRMAIIAAGIWATVCVWRFDVTRGNFVTGSMMFSAILMQMVVLLVRIVRGNLPFLSEAQYVSTIVLFFAIGKSYWDVRLWRDKAEDRKERKEYEAEKRELPRL
jgi:hypothetical protein